MIFRKALLLGACIALVGCLNLKQSRVTPEHRQLKNKVAVVVLMDPAPRVHHIQRSAIDSTATTLALPGWDVRRSVGEYLAQRMRGMALDVRAAPYTTDEFPTPYDSSMAYPAFLRLRPVLGEWAARQGLDMVVVVYRQAEEDFIGESVENLIGYGIARHADERTDAYAAIYLEALDTEGRLVGNSDGVKTLSLDASAWRAEFDVDRTPVAVTGADAEQLTAVITQVLHDAVLTAAQEAGLSH
ncbi:MAG: hypothetical protein AB7O21_12510 [Gammaproteobacteria bacterium]